MKKEITVGVITAIVIAIIYYLWGKVVSIPVPSGAVIAFSSKNCPEFGWEEYTAAYGRFIRGIDKSQQKIDPDSERQPGTLQHDVLKIHRHKANMKVGAEPVVPRGGARSNRAAGGHGAVSPQYETDDLIHEAGDPQAQESRPKNVALLYCKKL